MNIQNVAAIFGVFRLKDVEEALINHSVKGYTLQSVCARNEYFGSFNEFQLIKLTQMETPTWPKQVRDTASLITEPTHDNTVCKGLLVLCRTLTSLGLMTIAMREKTILNFINKV